MHRIIYLIIILISQQEVKAWQGNYYASTCNPQTEMAEYAFAQLPRKKFNAILDIGCGTGNFTCKLTKHAPFVLGVDYEPSMILAAQSLYDKTEHLSFATGDIRYLKNITAKFDLITAFHPLQWIPQKDQQLAFNRMAELLLPNGICLILVSDQMNSFYKPLMKVAQNDTWSQYFPANLEPWSWHTPASLRESFSCAGLHILRTWIWNKQYSFKSKNEYVNFIHNWLPNAQHFNYIPAHLKTQFFEEIINICLEEVVETKDGNFTFLSPFTIGIGEKKNA